ncbi:MAG: YihY/virulence factor BrkB family protein, partial [Armatimonadetes bacterium]|nr:YihY/virulence factor BrkB family protein [Armatimonadota bacterium]
MSEQRRPVPSVTKCKAEVGATGQDEHGWLWRVGHMFRLTYLRFGEAGPSFLAAAIGFYALTCFVPLGMFLVWVLGRLFGGQGAVITRIRDALAPISPQTAEEMTRRISESLSHTDLQVSGVLGLLALAWAGHRLFEILELALTKVWHGRPVRTFIVRKVVAFLLLIAAAGLLGGYMLLTSGIATLRARLMAADPSLGTAMSTLWRPLAKGLAEVLVFVAFFLIYRFIPLDRVPARVAALGALVATALFHAAAAIFSHFIARSTSYASLYGSMTSVVLFGLWAYALGIILLAAAALSAAYFDV